MLQLALLYLLTPTLTALLMLAAHWFPWNRGLAPLDRRSAYAIGAIGLVGIPVAAMILTELIGLPVPTLTWAGLLLVNAGAAGSATHLAYWIDSLRAVTLEDAHAHSRRQ